MISQRVFIKETQPKKKREKNYSKAAQHSIENSWIQSMTYVELKNLKCCIQLPFGIHIEKKILRSMVKTAAQSDIGNWSYGPKTNLITQKGG